MEILLPIIQKMNSIIGAEVIGDLAKLLARYHFQISLSTTYSFEEVGHGLVCLLGAAHVHLNDFLLGAHRLLQAARGLGFFQVESPLGCLHFLFLSFIKK